MTRDEAIKIVGYLNASYPNNKMDDAAAVVFMSFLAPLDFESCRYATKRWIENQKWFPSISEIVEATRHEMKRTMNDTRALGPGGRTLSREENQERLAEIQAQLRSSKGPLFNPRTRQAGLGSSAGVQPAPPAPRSPGGRSSSSPAEPTERPPHRQ